MDQQHPHEPAYALQTYSSDLEKKTEGFILGRGEGERGEGESTSNTTYLFIIPLYQLFRTIVELFRAALAAFTPSYCTQSLDPCVDICIRLVAAWATVVAFQVVGQGPIRQYSTP